MNTGVYHTENAGIYLEGESTGLLIDGIHEGKNAGFSGMDPVIEMQIWNRTGIFSKLRGLLFTHLHADHYDESNVRAYIEEYPDTAVWAPGHLRHCVKDYSRSEGMTCFSIGEFFIRAYDTEHSGSMFKEDKHACFLIENRVSGETIFLSGDALLGAELARRVIADVFHVDILFIMIYQAIEKSGKEFVATLRPGRVILYHNVDKKDDIYRQMAWTERLKEQDLIPGYTIETAARRKWIV